MSPGAMPGTSPPSSGCKWDHSASHCLSASFLDENRVQREEAAHVLDLTDQLTLLCWQISSHLTGLSWPALLAQEALLWKWPAAVPQGPAFRTSKARATQPGCCSVW